MTKMSSGRPSPHLRQSASIKYKKAPQAPRRFKSSYMFFSTKKHKEIRAELTKKGHGKVSTTEVAKMVSKAWKVLPDDEREIWEEMARQDKARYEMEKSVYTGPWKVPVPQKRMVKDPIAPKRPMSAFSAYSKSKRAYVKNLHKERKNVEISRILAQMWKVENAEEKQGFIDEERNLREEYKISMSEFIKRQNEEEMPSRREKREHEALQAIQDGKIPLRPEDLPHRGGNRILPPLISSSSSCAGRSAAADFNISPSVELDCSTQIAADIFGSSLSHQYFSHPIQQQQQLLSSGSNLPASPYGFSNDKYLKEQQQQPYSSSVVFASASSPSQYSQNQLQSSLDIYNNSVANGYSNPYGAAAHPYYQATSEYDSSYDRRYDTTRSGMGYDTYGQPHPYGYLPTSPYYQEGTYATATDHRQQEQPHSQRNVSGSQPYFQYDPNQSFDQSKSQSQH